MNWLTKRGKGQEIIDYIKDPDNEAWRIVYAADIEMVCVLNGTTNRTFKKTVPREFEEVEMWLLENRWEEIKSGSIKEAWGSCRIWELK